MAFAIYSKRKEGREIGSAKFLLFKQRRILDKVEKEIAQYGNWIQPELWALFHVIFFKKGLGK